MVVLNNVEVRLLVNGQVLSEYDDDEAEDSGSSDSASKFVEVVSGSRFGIEIRRLDAFDFGAANYMSASIYCDGKWMKNAPLFKKGHPRFYGTSVLVQNIHVGKGGVWKEFELHFGDVVTSSAGNTAQLNTQHKDLGIVQVSVRRKIAEDTPSVPALELAANVVNIDEIPEKSLKGRAVSMKTNLANGVPISPVKVFFSRDYDLEPLATFNFKYRSRKDLQALLIIPRSPSPIPLEERPEEDLSAEELRELVRRHRATDRRAESRKRERSPTLEQRSQKLKQESVADSGDDIAFLYARPRRQDRNEEIETIDLT